MSLDGDTSGSAADSSSALGDALGSFGIGLIGNLGDIGKAATQAAIAKHLSTAGSPASAVPENSPRLNVGQNADGTPIISGMTTIGKTQVPTWALWLGVGSAVLLVGAVTYKVVAG